MLRVATISVLTIGAVTLPLPGQSFSIGLEGGVRATDDFQYAATSESKRYVVGPTAELNLPLGFSIDLEALYRRQGYSTAGGSALYAAAIREADNVWEFPLLARYRIPFPIVRPFAEVGWVPRIMSGYRDESGSYFNFSSGTYSTFSGRTHVDLPTTYGIAAGGGVQFAAGRLQITPEVRYIHWNRQAVSGYFSDGPGYGSNQNQLDILLGISWRIGRMHL